MSKPMFALYRSFGLLNNCHKQSATGIAPGLAFREETFSNFYTVSSLEIFTAYFCQNCRGKIARWLIVRTNDRRPRGLTGFMATGAVSELRTISLTPLCQCLSEKTKSRWSLLYLLSVPGKVNIPHTRLHAGPFKYKMGVDNMLN